MVGKYNKLVYIYCINIIFVMFDGCFQVYLTKESKQLYLERFLYHVTIQDNKCYSTSPLCSTKAK